MGRVGVGVNGIVEAKRSESVETTRQREPSCTAMNVIAEGVIKSVTEVLVRRSNAGDSPFQESTPHVQILRQENRASEEVH